MQKSHRSKYREFKDADRFRYFGNQRVSFFRRFLLMPAELRHIRILRRCQFAPNRLLLFIYRVLLHLSTRKTHIQIPYETAIGKGLYIGHLGRLIIHPHSVLGSNVNLATGVTIGAVAEGKYQGAPVIEDNVWIGTNAVVVGNIRIGANSIIAPNAFVNRSVPPNSVVKPSEVSIVARHHSMRGFILNSLEHLE